MLGKGAPADGADRVRLLVGGGLAIEALGFPLFNHRRLADVPSGTGFDQFHARRQAQPVHMPTAEAREN